MKTKINFLLGTVLPLLEALTDARRGMRRAFLVTAVTLCIWGMPQAMAQTPANDNCSTAQPVSIGSYSGTTVGATPDPYGWVDFDADVWFSYTASEAGTLAIEICSSLPTSLTVWDANCDFGLISGWGDSCEDTGGLCGAPKSCLSAGIAPGTLLIRVATIGAVGDFRLNVSFTPYCPRVQAPPADWIRKFTPSQVQYDFAQAIDGDSDHFYVGGSASGALPGQNDLPGADAFLRKYNANGDEIWTRQLGTPSGGDVVADVAVDGSGIYVVGSVSAALPGQLHLGGKDAYLQKYDADGNLIWTRQFGTANDDQAFGVAANATGVYVVGFAGGPLPGQTDSAGFIRKYDSNGNEVWTRQFLVFEPGGGNYSSVSARMVAVDGTSVYVSGDLLVSGQFIRKYDSNGTYVWDTLMGWFNGLQIRGLAVMEGCGLFVAGSVGQAWMDGAPDPLGGSDAWIRKLDPNTGSWLWTRRFGTTDSDSVNALAVDATGVYVTGTTRGAFAGQTRSGEMDAFVGKFDCDGNSIWTSQFGATSSPGFPKNTLSYGVVSSPAGVAVVGEVQGALPGQEYYGQNDAFMRVHDSSGGELWTRQFGSLSGEQSVNVAGVASDGNTYVTGETTGLFPENSLTLTLGTLTAYVRKYGPDGTDLWTRQFGNDRGVRPRSIAVDATGVYVVGQTFGAFSTDGQTSFGGTDAFVAKLDHNGNRLWTRQFGSAGDDDGFTVSVGPSGVWVAGQSAAALSGQMWFGWTDAFIVRFDTEGNLLWTRQFGSAGWDVINGVASDASGAFATGTIADSGGFVRRFDISGTVVWNQAFPSHMRPTSLSTDGSSVYVAGTTTLYGGVSAFVRRFDGAGNALWTSGFGRNQATDNSNVTEPRGIAVTDSGVFVAGDMPLGGRLDCQATVGRSDCFVRKMNTAGEHVWTLQFGSPGYDSMGAISVDPLGISVAGWTLGTRVMEGFVLRLPDVNANQPPVPHLPAPFIAQCSAPVTVSVTLTDPDNDALTVVWTVDGVPYATHSLAAGATSDSITVAVSLGSHRIQVSVTDGKSDPVVSETTVIVPLFASDAIVWHQPLARNGASEDTDPSAGRTVKYRFKRGSTIPIQIHALNCAGTDVTSNANVVGTVTVFGDSNCDGAVDGNDAPIEFNGVGGSGGVMDKIGGHLKYNLDTTSLPTTTQCYILRVTVTDTSTGEEKFEEVLLQAK